MYFVVGDDFLFLISFIVYVCGMLLDLSNGVGFGVDVGSVLVCIGMVDWVF